jgi:D-3-phosphoglycerate dehydrogenase
MRHNQNSRWYNAGKSKITFGIIMEKYRILFSAPYMQPFIERFRPVFEHYGLELIIPDVHERLEADEILKYAGQFDGTICGDDRYNRTCCASAARA